VEDPAGTIVVVEDDTNIAVLVEVYLRRDGYRVLQASAGPGGEVLITRERPRLVILDIGLPGPFDGLELCRRVRAAGGALSRTPVLMLTARDSEIDRIVGLELGADDYLTKPFSPRELAARVKAILRRVDQPVGDDTRQVLTVGTLDVDLARREVRLAGKPVELATKEFSLLAYLVENQGIALSRRQLLDGVWGQGWFGDERTVDVHVRQLRKKLGEALPLTTVWGVGYRLG